MSIFRKTGVKNFNPHASTSERLASLEVIVRHLDNTLLEYKSLSSNDVKELKDYSTEQLNSLARLEITLIKSLNSQKDDFNSMLKEYDKSIKIHVKNNFVSKEELSKLLNNFIMKFCVGLITIIGTGITIAYNIFKDLL